jgi:hypothetical protein
MPIVEIVVVLILSVLAIAFIGLLPCLLMVAVQYISRLARHTDSLHEYKIYMTPSGRPVKPHRAAYGTHD